MGGARNSGAIFLKYTESNPKMIHQIYFSLQCVWLYLLHLLETTNTATLNLKRERDEA